IALWLFVVFCAVVLIVTRTQPALASSGKHAGGSSQAVAQRHEGVVSEDHNSHGSGGGGGDGGHSGDGAKASKQTAKASSGAQTSGTKSSSSASGSQASAPA